MSSPISKSVSFFELQFDDFFIKCMSAHLFVMSSFSWMLLDHYQYLRAVSTSYIALLIKESVVVEYIAEYVNKVYFIIFYKEHIKQKTRIRSNLDGRKEWSYSLHFSNPWEAAICVFDR